MHVQVDEQALQAEMARQIVAKMDLSDAVERARKVVDVAVRELVARPLAKRIAETSGIESWERDKLDARTEELVREMLGEPEPAPVTASADGSDEEDALVPAVDDEPSSF